MSRTALDEVSGTEPYKRLLRIVANLEVAAAETKDGALDFIAREVSGAFLDLCEELKKIKIEPSGTATIPI